MWNGGKCGTSCTGDNVRGVNSRTLCAVRHDFLWGEIAMRLWRLMIGAVLHCVLLLLSLGAAAFFSARLQGFDTFISIFYYHHAI